MWQFGRASPPVWMPGYTPSGGMGTLSFFSLLIGEWGPVEGEASTTPISLLQAQLKGVGMFAKVSSHAREKPSGILRKEEGRG